MWGGSWTLFSKFNFQAGTLKHDLLTSCCLLLSRCGCGGGSTGPAPAQTTQRATQSYRQCTPRFKGSPPIHQLHQSQAPGPTASLEARATTTITPPPPQKKKLYANWQAVWDARIAKTIPTPTGRVCVYRGEGE